MKDGGHGRPQPRNGLAAVAAESIESKVRLLRGTRLFESQ